MASSKKPRSIKLRQTVEFTFAPVPFVPFQSVGTLDVEKLSRARHAVVEFGQFTSDSCKRTARAVIRNGQVTEITLDACADAEKNVTPAFAKLFARAQAKLRGPRTPAPRLPMPVTRFFVRRRPFGAVTIGTEIKDGMLCCIVCIDVYGTRVCTVCCGKSSDDITCLGIRS